MSDTKSTNIINFTSFSYFLLFYSALDVLSQFYWTRLWLSLFLSPHQATHCCVLVVCFEILNFFGIGFRFWTGSSVFAALQKSNEDRIKDVLKNLDQSNVSQSRANLSLDTSNLRSFRYRDVDENGSLNTSDWSQSLNESSTALSNFSWTKNDKINESLKFREFRGAAKNAAGPNSLELSHGSAPHNSIYTEGQYSRLMFKDGDGHKRLNESSFARKIDFVFSGTHSSSFQENEIKDYQLGYISSTETKLDVSLKSLLELQDVVDTEKIENLNRSDSLNQSTASSSTTPSTHRLNTSKDEYSSSFARKAAKLRDAANNLNTTTSPSLLFSDSKKFGRKDNTLANVVVHNITNHDEIMNGLSTFSLKFRLFMRESVLKPFIDAVDSANNDLHKINANFTIGNSGLDVLQLALEQKKELVGTQLPFLLPFLKIHSNQYYLVRRIRQLAKTPLLHGYVYNKAAKVEMEEGLDIPEASFSDRPVDAELLFSFFCVYMDHCIVPDSLAKLPTKPFSSVYAMKDNAPPSFVQRLPTNFYIRMKHQQPEGVIFEFVSNGSNDIYSFKPGPENLFAVLHLFFKHCFDKNDGYLGEMRLDRKGLNLASLLQN